MKKRQPIRFLEPAVQRRMIAAVLTCVGVTSVVAGSVATWSLHGLAVDLSNDHQEVLAQSIPFGLRVGAVALAVSLPLLALMALAATMPLIGVHHRIRTYLTDVLDGAQTGELSLRDEDPLHDVAAMINEATLPYREARGAEVGQSPEVQRDAA